MATQVTISGTLKDAEGNNLSGTITFRPDQPLYDSDGNMVVGTAPVVATLASGAFSITVYATDDATTSPTGGTYTVIEELTGADGSARNRRFRCEIPSASATLRYEDITEALPSNRSVVSYATAAQIAGFNAHTVDTTDVHGIADTSALLTDSDRGAANGVASLDADTLVPLAQLPASVERAVQSAQHVDAARGLDAGLAALEAGLDDLRVVIAGDSMVELAGGFSNAAAASQALLDGRRAGQWFAPGWVLWPFVDATYAQEGTAGTHGLDGHGRILTAGQAVGSPSTEVTTGTVVRVYYTARVGGGSLDVEIDGVVADTIDTSLLEDQATSAVATVQGQCVDVTVTAGAHTIQVVGNAGTSWLDAYEVPADGGVVWQGVGLSGTTTPVIQSGGGLVEHVQAMTDRGEEPHLVIVHADTAEVTSDATWASAAAALTTLVGELQDAAPTASIAHVIPCGHNALTEADAARWAQEWRTLHRTLGVLTVDTWASLGHVGNAYDPRGLSDDGVHLNAKGQRIADATLLDVILARTVRTVPLSRLPGVTIADPAALAEGTIPVFDADGELVATAAESPVHYEDGSNTFWHLGKAPAAIDTALGGTVRAGFAYNAIFGLQVRATLGGVDAGVIPLVVGTPTGSTQAATKGYVDAPTTVAVSASRALAFTDLGATLLVSAAATLTLANISTTLWPVGGACRIVQTGTGVATVAAGGGQTLYSPGGAASVAQGQEGVLRRVASTVWTIDWLSSPSGRILGWVDGSPTRITGDSSAASAITGLDSITFTVPPSGKVLVRASLVMTKASGGDARLCVRDGSGTVTGSARYLTNSGALLRLPYEAVMTGLTPGASITWSLGWTQTTGTVTVRCDLGVTWSVTALA